MKLKVTKHTVFKREPKDSSALPATLKLSVPEGEYDLKAADDMGSHLYITLATPLDGKLNWYVFEDHIELLKETKHPTNTDAVGVIAKGKPVVILNETYYLDSPILEGGNFTWGEATHNGVRLPKTKEHLGNIIGMAEGLEDVRSHLDNRVIRINSWFRPEPWNSRVGGAKSSQHLTGKAADIRVDGLSPKEVQRRLDGWWKGGLGYGETFTHLDNRRYRVRFGY